MEKNNKECDLALFYCRGKGQRKIFSVDSPVKLNVIVTTTQPWRGCSSLTNADGTLVIGGKVQLCREGWISGIHTPEYLELGIILEIPLGFTCLIYNLYCSSCLHWTVMEKTPHMHTQINTDWYAHIYIYVQVLILSCITQYISQSSSENWNRALPSQMLQTLKSLVALLPHQALAHSSWNPFTTVVSVWESYQRCLRTMEMQGTANNVNKPLS